MRCANDLRRLRRKILRLYNRIYFWRFTENACSPKILSSQKKSLP